MKTNYYRKADLLYDILIYIMCSMNLFIMHYMVSYNANINIVSDVTILFDNILGVFFDLLCLLLIIFTVLSIIKKNGLVPIVLFIMSLALSFSNVVYSRFFSSYISLSSWAEIDALFEPLVISSTLQGIKIVDIIFILLLLFFILFSIRVSLGKGKNMIYIGLSLLLTSIIIDLGAHAIKSLSKPESRYLSYYWDRLYLCHIAERESLCSPQLATFKRGLFRTAGMEFYRDIKGNIPLDNKQLDIIYETIQGSRRSMTGSISCKKKNVIFIIVESYMSFTSDLIINGIEITPHLNAIKHDSLTYYNGNLDPNITLGESSDGQFIYMTGILPLRSSITISKAKNIALPSLAKDLSKLGINTRMIIPTTPSLWNQDVMCEKYGFNKLYSCLDYNTNDKEHHNLTDEEVFSLAMELDKNDKSAFFEVILTLSMHQPYNSSVDNNFHINGNMSDELRNYLIACHYTDKQIGKYIENLKHLGLYDDCLIIIASDHHAHGTDFSKKVPCKLPLYIINMSHVDKNYWKGNCNQLDVYTTILNAMGVQPKWTGLGHSLLSTTYTNSVNEMIWNISESIILGDYFSIYNKY